MCLIFVGCHDPRKYFNTKILRTKNFDTKVVRVIIIHWIPCYAYSCIHVKFEIVRENMENNIGNNGQKWKNNGQNLQEVGNKNNGAKLKVESTQALKPNMLYIFSCAIVCTPECICKYSRMSLIRTGWDRGCSDNSNVRITEMSGRSNIKLPS